jgi:hypothetical protein
MFGWLVIGLAVIGGLTVLGALAYGLTRLQ